jgi:four helix bundle protein
MTWGAERDALLNVASDTGATEVREPAATYGSAKPYSIVERTRLFALEIISFTRVVRESGWRSLSEQLFDSGTSIGANMSEAQQAESRRDFIHKCRIAAKEAKETSFWLSLCRDSPHLPYTEGMYEESDALNAILATIIARAINNAPKRKRP